MRCAQPAPPQDKPAVEAAAGGGAADLADLPSGAAEQTGSVLHGGQGTAGLQSPASHADEAAQPGQVLDAEAAAGGKPFVARLGSARVWCSMLAACDMAG